MAAAAKGVVFVLFVVLIMTGLIHMYISLESGPARTIDDADCAEIRLNCMLPARKTELCEIQKIHLGQDWNTNAADIQKTSLGVASNTDESDIQKTFQRQDRNTEMAETQEARLRRIREICTAKPSFKENEYYLRNQARYVFSEAFNFSICSVPKSGSTFLKQTVYFLDHETINASTTFSVPRHIIQTQNVLTYEMSHSVPVILVSRDPFTRLFSCYIDRVYLLESIGPKNRNKTSRCSEPVSFQAFLDDIFVKFAAGQNLDIHFAPVYSFCRPCEDNVDFLLKQETFSEDLKYILEVFRVEWQRKYEIIEALHNKRSEYTARSLFAHVYHFASNQLRCIGAKGVAEKLWTSFQIQGYIKDTVQFPDDIDVTRWKDVSFVKHVIMQTIADHPMSENQQRAQRQAALVKAYRGVREDTIAQIRQHYKTDFDLFGYDRELPH